MSENKFKINLDNTINSGQVFLWNKIDGYWYGIHGQDVLKVDERTAKFSSIKKKDYDIFRDGDKLELIYNSLQKDPTLKYAISKYEGLRIMRQEPFQCTISFIISSNSSISKIKKSLFLLCKKFGKRVIFDNKEFFTFPKPIDIANAKTSQLAECGLGYRTAFVKNAAKIIIDEKIDFEKLKIMPYYDAKKIILAMDGIGNKVADCILLFSLDHLEAFPLDRWMIRSLQRHYASKFEIKTKTITSKQYEMLHEKIINYFGPYAGYAQQFLFKMERDSNQKTWL